MTHSPTPPTTIAPPPRTGYTLPVFACASAIAALHRLHGDRSPLTAVTLNLVEPAATADIPIEQVSCLSPTSALAITRSDPGDNLDLTRDTPIWAVVERGKPDQIEAIAILGGEGIGRQTNPDPTAAGQTVADQQPAIYAYARRLLHENLTPLLQPDEKIRVTLILPEGRSLAARTSNAAFGVVEGLSLLGTSGISQPLSAPGQLEAFRAELRQKATRHRCLVFCIGENGLDLGRQMGMNPDCMVKTANWLGPLLAEAGMQEVESILLFGYHGKLLKLAGGIFHTHHHVADGRQEIFAAQCANVGLPIAEVQAVFACETAEAALQHLRQLDTLNIQPDSDDAAGTTNGWVARVYGAIAQQIDRRSEVYIHAHSDRRVQVGSILFGRDRQIIHFSPTGSALLPQVLLS